MPNVRSNVTRVAMPSANVFGGLADDAGARSPGSGNGVGILGADADDPRLQAESVADRDQPARAASAADGHEHDVDVRERFEDLERIRADARNQVGLVGGVHVAQVLGVALRFHELAGLVEVAAVLDERRAPGAHHRVLGRVVVAGTTSVHGTPARAAAKAIDWPWFPVVAEITPRARSLGRQARDQIETAAHLEGAGRVVVLVLDPDVETQLLRQQRMPKSGVGFSAA